MSAVIDKYTGLPDAGLQRDAALELEIDAAHEKIRTAPNEAESRDWLTQLAVLIRRRSQTQLLKLELERRMRTRTR